MSHVITRACCNDATCVDVCPVGCIHPTPAEAGYARAEMLYIDPRSCIDCGACVDVCPVDAIVHADSLAGTQKIYADINARYFSAAAGPQPQQEDARPPLVQVNEPDPLRVAIVGSGPAGCFAAEELLRRSSAPVHVEMFDRLPTPWGLVRLGVAPDHQDTKTVSRLFARTAAHADVRLHLNVRIGEHVSHAELLEHHHAVIYAVGAPDDRRMSVPGEHLPGSYSAAEFVAWYNGHPDHADRRFDLSSPRAVIVGNGNVALDVARLLVTDVDRLARTDIADHALEALSRSAVREVVVLGRRGPAEAAFTLPELIGLDEGEGYRLTVTPDGLEDWAQPHAGTEDSSISTMKAEIIAEIAGRDVSPDSKRVVLRFGAAPVELVGTDTVEGIRVAGTAPQADGQVRLTGGMTDIDSGLVLRCIGFRGREVPGIPFDHRRGTIPNESGRVVDPDAGVAVRGVYTSGWIKRGPSGVIGTNKRCAIETVSSLLADHEARLLAAPVHGADHLLATIDARQPQRLDYDAWKAVDAHERGLGRQRLRPRTKLVTVEDVLRVARPERVT